MVFKNLGFVFSEYSETSDTRVPFDLQVGATFKPEHMPIRFSLTAYNLASGGSAYDNPDDEEDDLGSLDKLLRHVSLGAEILIHRNVNMLMGYNFLRQKELNTPEGGGAGFSFGTSIKIKSLDLAMSRTRYSVGNAAYAFTLSADINTMFFRKRI